MLDHFGPDRIRPGDEGGLNRIRIGGFETVTFLFQGAMEHHDSSGGHGPVERRWRAWMTAAPASSTGRMRSGPKWSSIR